MADFVLNSSGFQHCIVIFQSLRRPYHRALGSGISRFIIRMFGKHETTLRGLTAGEADMMASPKGYN